MKRFLTLILALSVSICVFAQKQVVVTNEYSSFSGIYATDNFEISFVKSDSYSVRILTDALIQDFVQAYVKDNILVLDIDLKAITADIKKELKTKPELLKVKAEISAAALESLTINGNSIVDSEAGISSDTFRLNLSKNAIIKKLDIDADKVGIELYNKTQARISCRTKTSINLYATNSAIADIKIKTGKIDAEANSFAKIELLGEADSVIIKSNGNSSIEYQNKAQF